MSPETQAMLAKLPHTYEGWKKLTERIESTRDQTNDAIKAETETGADVGTLLLTQAILTAAVTLNTGLAVIAAQQSIIMQKAVQS